ncbi:unnamed protein product, partial [marine sediment metagenome]
LIGGEYLSYALGVSADGSVIVGGGHTELGEEAFRWSADNGMVGLGHLPRGYYTQALDVSGNGSIVVGKSNYKAFIWDDANGMRNLKNVLEDDYGLDLSDWKKFLAATAISDDGKIIVGWGDRLDGPNEAWIVFLSSHPHRQK